MSGGGTGLMSGGGRSMMSGGRGKSGLDGCSIMGETGATTLPWQVAKKRRPELKTENLLQAAFSAACQIARQFTSNVGFARERDA
jgi:hypothetical protein